MFAKIVSKNREYYSFIFAKFNPGWYESVIVFDSENKRFELVDVYDRKPSLKRRVFIIDTDATDMVEKKTIKISIATTYKDCFGFNWILENSDLIKQIKDGKNVDEKYIEIAEKLNNNIDTSEWKYVKNQKDADDLLTAAWDFHDAVIKSVTYKRAESYGDPNILQVLFTECWECDILLEFKNDVLIHFSVDDNNIPDILDSNILFHDGFVYWVDDHIENIKDISEENIYFRARSLSWKMITKENKE